VHRQRAKRTIPTILWVLSLLVGLLFPAVVTAQDPVTLEARVGFDGYTKSNSWIPIHVVIANEGPGIEGTVRVASTGGASAAYTQPAVLPTHSRKQFTLYAWVTYSTHELEVRLDEGAQTLARQTVRIQLLDERDYLYGVVSDDPAALNYLAGLPPRNGTRRTHIAHLALSDLPAQGRALTAVDALILDNVDTAPLSHAQREALRGWVGMGGHLVICGGPHADRTAAGLGDLLPVDILGSETTTDVSELGEYAGAPFIAQMPAVVARIAPANPSAQILAGAPDRPFLVRQGLDAGSIDYLAVDPALEPMRTWVGNDNLWTRLTPSAPLSERLASGANPGSIASALANSPGMATPSALLVIGFLLLYVVTVGPLNFLVLKWIDRRPLAWVTVPALILTFSCVATVVGLASRGRKLVVSEISIVRPHLSSRTAVVDTTLGLYSPARRAYDVRLPGGVLVRQVDPTQGLGSMQGKNMTVEQGPPTWLRDIDIDVGELRPVLLQTIQPWAGIETDLVLTVQGSTYHVEGTIANRGDADVTGCALLFQSHPVAIPDLKVGETLPIAADFDAPVPIYQLVDDLMDKTLSGVSRQERARRREILHGVLQYGRTSVQTFGSGQGPAGLSLLGWMSDSVLPVEVLDAASTTHTTALLFASLPVSSGDPDSILLPLRSSSWEYTGPEPDVSPYALHGGTGSKTFVFRLASGAQGRTVDALFLHVDSLEGFAFGNLPDISIQEIASQAWQPVGPLSWGANAIPNPARFVDREAKITIRVDTMTINVPISVDLSAIYK
jgi:hypothetical protein